MIELNWNQRFELWNDNWGKRKWSNKLIICVCCVTWTYFQQNHCDTLWVCGRGITFHMKYWNRRIFGGKMEIQYVNGVNWLWSYLNSTIHHIKQQYNNQKRWSMTFKDFTATKCKKAQASSMTVPMDRNNMIIDIKNRWKHVSFQTENLNSVRIDINVEVFLNRIKWK